MDGTNATVRHSPIWGRESNDLLQRQNVTSGFSFFNRKRTKANQRYPGGSTDKGNTGHLVYNIG